MNHLPPARIAGHVRWENQHHLNDLAATLHMAVSRVRHDLATTGLPGEEDLTDVIATATAMLAGVSATRALLRVERALDQQAQAEQPYTRETVRTGDPARPTLVVLR